MHLDSTSVVRQHSTQPRGIIVVCSTDWIGVASLAFTVGGAFGSFVGWIAKGRQERRAALPMLRRSGDHITIVNRLDEDLRLTRLEVNVPYCLRLAYNDDGVFDPDAQEWIDHSIQYDMLIKSKGEGTIFVMPKREGVAPIATLTFNSVTGILRNKRIPVPLFLQIDTRDHASRSWVRWLRFNS